MRNVWNETSGANRFVIIGVAIALAVIVLGAMIIGTNLLGDKHQQTQGGVVDDGLGDVVSTPTTKAPGAQRSNVTQTTLYNGMTQQQIEHPESDQQNATQLQYQFNQQSSGLPPKTYQYATQVGKDFVLASATGSGEDKFSDYYETIPNDPWVDNYQFIYASAMATDDPTLVKVVVWFTGKERASGLIMESAKQGVFVTRSSASSLDFKPKIFGGAEPPPDDPDYGISVH